MEKGFLKRFINLSLNPLHVLLSKVALSYTIVYYHKLCIYNNKLNDLLFVGGYPQQHQGTTVVVAQPPVTVVQQFRETPVHTRCPHCQAEVVTATSYETGTFAWIICLVLCLIG